MTGFLQDRFKDSVKDPNIAAMIQKG